MMLREFLAGSPARFSPDQRADMARRDGRALLEGDWNDAERLIVEQILRILAKDAEARVREALAEALAESERIPRDIAIALAEDSDLIALPMLRCCPVFSKTDLERLAKIAEGEPKLAALAARKDLDSATTEILIEKGSEGVILTLLKNDTAEVSERGFHTMLDRHGGSEPVQRGIVERHVLPASIVERLVHLISSILLENLVARHSLSSKSAAELATAVRARAAIGLAAGLSQDALAKLIGHLEEEKRLSPSLLLRSICTGNVEILFHTIAARSHLGVEYIRSRLVAGDETALRKFWTDARMPPELLAAAEVCIRALVGTAAEADKWDADYYQRRVVERVLTALDAAGVQISDEVADSCLSTAAGPVPLSDFVAPEAKPSA